jgi:hypothetical protein
VKVIRCDEVQWRFLGLSLAGYNVLISLGLAAVAGWGCRADNIADLGARPDRVGDRAFIAGWPAQAAVARVNSFRRLWAVQIMAHSARTFRCPATGTGGSRAPV